MHSAEHEDDTGTVGWMMIVWFMMIVRFVVTLLNMTTNMNDPAEVILVVL